MKNKIGTYVLVIAVLCIWGAIGYKIINGLNPSGPAIFQQDINTNFNPKKTIQSDTFSVKTVGRDPFLGTLASRQKKKTQPVDPPEKEQIPFITYGGLIEKQQSSEQVFVLNIDQQQYLLKIGQIADNVKLIKGNSKEIVVRYKGKIQTIKKL